MTHKIFSAALIAFFLIGSYQTSVWAAEPMKKATADHVLAPTKVKPLDINSAAIEDLKRLPGIDETYAQKIMENRPYDKKEQLISRKVIPLAAYNKIKDRIITVQNSLN